MISKYLKSKVPSYRGVGEPMADKLKLISFQGEIDDDDDMIADDDGYNPNDVKLKASKLAAAVAAEADAAAADKDAEEVLNEFNFLSNPDGVDGKGQDEG